MPDTRPDFDARVVACYDCGLPYDSDDWLDTVLPDVEWLRISPAGHDGGILCANCIVKRLRKIDGSIVMFARLVTVKDHEAFRVLKNVSLNEVRDLLAQLDDRQEQVERLTQERDELQKDYDAFMEGQEASLKGLPRESNPYPAGDSYGVPNIYQQWDDGYDCNINRALKKELTALHAAQQAVEGRLRELVRNWANAETRMRGLDAGLPGSGYDKLADGYGTCADELTALLQANAVVQPAEKENKNG